MTKKDLLNFVRKHNLAVISTVSKKGFPEAAVIEFAETNNLEIIFDTMNSSRKYKNIKNSNKVAFVIGWDENITVQYEGEAFELEEKELEKYQAIYLKKIPEAKKWIYRSGIVFFKVKPTWIRSTNLNQHPWEIFEFNF